MTAELQRRAFLTKLKRDSTFWASYPHPHFPTISITGSDCALNCRHCGGRYLRQMIPCRTPDVLRKTCIELAEGGAHGVLISGGYNGEGYVPFEPFLDAIEEVKRETGLFLNIHTGLVPPRVARGLGEAGVDMVSFDMIGSGETVELVLGIKRGARDYERTLRTLAREIPHVAPHICVGLHEGRLKGERKALRAIEGTDISALVFLVIIPTPGTPFEGVQPPSPAAVGELIAEARLEFPEIPLTLGCMRPRTHGAALEIEAVNSGVDRIVIPNKRTLEVAWMMGLKIKRLDACCAVPDEAAGAWTSGEG